MSIASYRAVEPLYIIILHNQKQAESVFRSWIRDNKIDHAHATGNRMMLHEQRAFEQFKLTWSHDISNLTIWDTWLRRHIYLD
jgi:hypothetical protein